MEAGFWVVLGGSALVVFCFFVFVRGVFSWEELRVEWF